MRSAMTLILGILLAAIAPGVYAQAKPAAKGAKPAAKSSVKRSVHKRAKPAAPKAPAKQIMRRVPKPAATPQTEAAPAEKPAESETKMARRDPFESLINVQKGNAKANLPPGIAGLQVGTLQLNGIVKAPNGMIAVVTNPQSRTYFLREGDQLYDGRVDKIAMDSVTFHEEGKDAFGKPVERQVSKRLYSSAGEQQ
jgi:Tfp pilus assembly protein PilP